MTQIDINMPVADIIDKNPEVKDDLIKIGFSALANPIMLKSVGKKMSIKRGAKMMGVENVEQNLKDMGYDIIDSSFDKDVIQRKDMIKSYIKRLSDGEGLEEVRADFKENFSEVSSSEIMDAEESLLDEGMDKKEVRRLCDVHSSLFHGMTIKEDEVKEYENPVLNYFNDENNEIKGLVNKLKAFISGDICDNPSKDLGLINLHYKKKGDLIYPLLKAKYNKPGPSEVMWAVDGEITRDISKAIKKNDMSLLEKASQRADEMTYKEENILYPLMLEKFSDQDYLNIYNDLKEYDASIEDRYPYESSLDTPRSEISSEGYVNFAKGRLRVDQLEAMLDTMEIEITYVDENDINSYYNDHKGEKIFKRPKSSLGRDVYSCHPPQAEPKVRKIMADLKAGKRDKVVVIRDIAGSDYTVSYYGVWDKDGNYKGVLETVQNMDFYKDYLKKWNKL